MKDFVSIITFVGLAIGILVGYYSRKFIAARLFDHWEAKAKEIEEKAKRQAQEILLKAKEESLNIIEAAKKDEILMRKELKFLEEKLEKRRSVFDQKLLEIEEVKQNLTERVEKIKDLEIKTQKLEEGARRNLEKISKLSSHEAKKLLLDLIEKENKEEILVRLRKLKKEGEKEIERRTKELLILATERYAGSIVQEKTTSTVGLPNEEMKGRIIGREGRNIKTLEQLTGVEVIIDDTPEVVTISCFSPLRREIAKRALEKLIVDGRIQPVRIERVVEEVKKDISKEIKEAGEEAAYRVGVVGLDPELTQLIGRLKYRTSYGQNVLQHSIEVAIFGSLIASELGINESIVKKAGLLHDIGKAVDHQIEGTHPEIGKKIAEKFGLSKEIIIPIAAHHEDYPPTLEAIIVKVADVLSGARPGARADTYEEYLKRLENLEKIALSFAGVEKSYCLSAGREIRIFVKTEEINDLEAEKLARQIAKKIEEELEYPGEIRVTVIRETKITDYAR